MRFEIKSLQTDSIITIITAYEAVVVIMFLVNLSFALEPNCTALHYTAHCTALHGIRHA
jgi:hypothetical protein